MSIKHFLDLNRLDAATLRHILDIGLEIRRVGGQPLAGKTLAMIFEKNSTRTRVSFEVGIRRLGGEAVVLNTAESQIGRGETIADTARVLSRFVDAIMIRTDKHEKLLELADYATVPVINGLTDDSHPCQVMADIMTYEQHRGPITGKTVLWTGDGNNVARSFVHAATRFGFALRLACPNGYDVDAETLEQARREGAVIETGQDPLILAEGVDLVVTDAWVSMGESKENKGIDVFQPYQVNATLMARARKNALFMHCLPAHRDEEVTDEVMDGPQSVVWDEAENRLHAQNGILVWCLRG